ncbi:MAG: hypothetical protein OSB45_14095 [Pseudomonadales bacterium]|nr:hypothetical protein [Pseudomonadales bacterium]
MREARGRSKEVGLVAGYHPLQPLLGSRLPSNHVDPWKRIARSEQLASENDREGSLT